MTMAKEEVWRSAREQQQQVAKEKVLPPSPNIYRRLVYFYRTTNI
jgi:hypothetical protein